MDYYDGNTVTGLWNYAQNYAMSDNNWDTIFGPSTPGALNLISGQTGNAYAVDPTTGAKVEDPRQRRPAEQRTAWARSTATSTPPSTTAPTPATPRPARWASRPARTSATCSTPGTSAGAGSRAASRRPATNAAGFAVCGTTHQNIGGDAVIDYSPHHNPFEYYKSTANPKHLPPSSEAAIGHTDQANHQYDLSDFYTTLKDGNMPAVSFLKAAEYQDGAPRLLRPAGRAERSW